MFPLFRWGNIKWLAPGYKHVGGLVRARHCYVITHLIHDWFWQNSKKQITGKSFWVQCSAFNTHLSSSHTWALTSEGKLDFYMTSNTCFLHNTMESPTSNCQLISDTISVELVPKPQVEVSRLPWLQMSAMWAPVTMHWKSNFPWPQLHAQTPLNQGPSSGKLLLTFLTLMYRIKWEIAKWRRRLGQRGSRCEQRVHALVSPAPSPHHHFFPPQKLSEPIFMDFYWGFTQ